MPRPSREDKARAVRDCPDLLRAEWLCDGTTRYIFTGGVFTGLDSAYHHALAVSSATARREKPDAQPGR